MTAPAPMTTRIWNGIEAEHPPVRRGDHAALLAMAQGMLATRQRNYPQMIRAGQIDGEVAQAEIAAFTALVADWQWICTGQGAPAGIDTRQQRIDALDASIATIADIAREQGGFDEKLAQQGELVIALRWHLEPGSSVYFYAARRHARALCQTCERRADDPATQACTRADCGLTQHERKAA